MASGAGRERGGGGRAFIYDRINKHSFVNMVMLAGGWFWVVGRISIVNSSSVFVLLGVYMCVFMLYLYARWENGEKHERVLMHEYSLPERNRDWNQSSS